ncbi:MAG TPA: DUF1761 domain-containing protein [Flavisolibacter sp.]|nr:DUF1761 domain-containing protein [Flavisolibacter sp.]
MDTAFLQQLEWLHILVATLAYFSLGAIWYGPLFSKKWIAYHGINVNDPGMKKGVAGIMLLSFVLFFLVTTGLAILIGRLELAGVLSGLKLGLFTGTFFSAAAISITYLYLQKPFGLHFIEGLYHIIGQALAAIILCIW